MKTLLMSVALIAIVAGATEIRTAAAADPDPVVGTWQLNASKSTFKSGPTLKSQTRTYSQSGEKITLEMKTVSAEGKEVATHTTYQLNGKDFPVTGSSDYDSLSGKQVNANTAEFTLKKGGKVVGHTSRTISKDGKTLTTKTNVTTASGEKAESVLVLEKQ
jgi:hypothetical protein